MGRGVQNGTANAKEALACGYVNAKNKVGAYAGDALYLFMWTDGREQVCTHDGRDAACAVLAAHELGAKCLMAMKTAR